MPVEDLVPIEPVSETVTPAARVPMPPSTPPTPPPVAAIVARPPAPLPPPAPVPPPAVVAPQVSFTPIGRLSAPPRQPAPPALEDQFFSDTEGKNSQPLSTENVVPIRSNRVWAIVLIGGLALGIIVGIIAQNSSDEVATTVDAGVTVVTAPVDAGEPEALDAGETAIAVVPEEIVDAGEVAEATVDAGEAPVVAVVRDAGPEAVAVVIDAGPALAVVVVKDAGSPVADAGALAVVVKDAGTTSPIGEGSALARLVDDAKAALVAQKYRKAVQLYRDAIKLQPDDSSLRSGLGIALVMSDLGYKEAIPYLKDAVKEDPSSHQAWLALGIAFQNLGRDAEAKGPYKEFLKLKPRGSQADEVRAALQAIP